MAGEIEGEGQRDREERRGRQRERGRETERRGWGDRGRGAERWGGGVEREGDRGVSDGSGGGGGSRGRELYTTSVDIQKARCKKLVTHAESHASALSLLESGE